MSYIPKNLKKKNKSHCKSAPLKIRIKFFFVRNEEEIKTIIISAITSLIVQLTIKFLL